MHQQLPRSSNHLNLCRLELVSKPAKAKQLALGCYFKPLFQAGSFKSALLSLSRRS